MAANTTIIQGNSIIANRPPVNIPNSVMSIPGRFNGSSIRLGVNYDLLSKHTLIVGGTGCGKTNVFNFYIKELKPKMSPEDVMIIFDTKGDFFSKFYRTGDVVIANSKRYAQYATNWNIFKEIVVDGWDEDDILSNVYEITHALFKDAIEKTSQPFFPSAARNLLAAILIAHVRLGKDSLEYKQKFFNNRALRQYLDSLSIEGIRKLLKPFNDLSSALMYLGNDENGQALGVLAELQNVSRQVFIGTFAKDGRFSARSFVREKGAKTLFIEYDLSMGETLAPIYRILYDLALKEAMGRNKSSGNVYFICDEFKLLPNLSHIEDSVNFGRGLGVKMISGIQSIEQLYEVYGESKGRNIAAGFSSVIAFRPNDTVTREFISDLFGRNIILEQYRTSGNALIEEKREGKTVEDWDLINLKTGEAIVAYAGEKPFKFMYELFNG